MHSEGKMSAELGGRSEQLEELRQMMARRDALLAALSCGVAMLLMKSKSAEAKDLAQDIFDEVRLFAPAVAGEGEVNHVEPGSGGGEVGA